jgi:hypothetical protein
MNPDGTAMKGAMKSWSGAFRVRDEGGCSRRAVLRAFSVLLPAAFLPGRSLRASVVPNPTPVPVDLGFIQRELPLLRRSEWTDVLPKPWKLKVAEVFDRITVHHSGAGTNYHTSRGEVLRDLEGVIVSHLERNYGDIGYHFVIDYTGAVWEGRSLAYEGAHVEAQNERNLGIMALGNFEEQSPSAKQLEATDRLVALLRQRFKVKPHRVFGHRDLGHSVCPGRSLYAHVRQMRVHAVS